MVVDCIIPARFGSKGIIKKNIQLLGGYPLLAYSIAAAKLSKNIENVYISTDSREFSEIAEFYGAKALYLRPKSLSKDKSLDIDFFKYHIDFCNNNNIILANYLVNLRPTTPLREVDIINDAIYKFINDKNSTSLRSAHKIDLTPYKMFKKEGKYMKAFIEKDNIKESHSAARQLFEDTFVGNGYIDVINTNLIIKKDVLYGDSIFLYETDVIPDIDKVTDLKESEICLKSGEYSDLIHYIKGCHK